MDIASAAINALLSVAAFVMFMGGVLKLFQILTALGEIKEILQAIRASGSVLAAPKVAPPAYSAPAASFPLTSEPASALPLHGRSGEEMLRELDAQMRFDEASKALNSESADR